MTHHTIYRVTTTATPQLQPADAHCDKPSSLRHDTMRRGWPRWDAGPRGWACKDVHIYFLLCTLPDNGEGDPPISFGVKKQGGGVFPSVLSF